MREYIRRTISQFVYLNTVSPHRNKSPFNLLFIQLSMSSGNTMYFVLLSIIFRVCQVTFVSMDVAL